MYFEMINQLKRTLTFMDGWLNAAVDFAESRKFDPNALLGQRLAPDQFAFARQVQIACDTAKLGAARLAGKTAPSHADTETTVDQLRARLSSVIGYLDTFTAADFSGAAVRVITQPRWEGKVMSGADYFLEHVVPNFYFHAAHAYAILRHSGVMLGKRDYLGPLTQRLP